MRRALAIATTIATVFTSAVFLTAGSAAADPSANDWYQLRMCESSNRYDINTGNGYYGAYQFDLSTWQSVGGSGMPNDATPAKRLVDGLGVSWPVTEKGRAFNAELSRRNPTEA